MVPEERACKILQEFSGKRPVANEVFVAAAEIRAAISEERWACAKQLDDAAAAVELLYPESKNGSVALLLRGQAIGLRAREGAGDGAG